jgi:glucokinase-like ROK family protein
MDMKADKSWIHTINKKMVLTLIRERGPIYKAEIARLTGLSIPTVIKITDELAEHGLVRDIGKGMSSGGKPPQLLEFASERYAIIGVDVGTTNINCVLMDLAANVLCQYTTPTIVSDPSKQVIERIVRSIERVMAMPQASDQHILGIGVGMPGLLEEGVVLFSPDFHWEQVDLIGRLRERFHLPIQIHNVTRAMAMGERWFGHGRGEVNSFICVNLGYGIGAALYLDGRIFNGGSGTSGELGHMTVDSDGPVCACGRRGCLESLAAGNAIARRAEREMAEGRASSIAPARADAELEAKDVFLAAARHDPLAMEIIHDTAEYIGTALANVITLLDPEVIILEGGLSRAGEPFIDEIRQVVKRFQMKYAGRNTRIVVSGLGENAAAIGAATYLLQRLFDVGGDVEAI